MNSLFAPKPANIRQTSNSIPVQTQQQPQIQNDLNAINYAQSMLQRSGGDAKAAFYLAAKEKGIDPEEIITLANSVKDPRMAVQKFLMRTPQAKNLMSLFSMMK